MDTLFQKIKDMQDDTKYLFHKKTLVGAVASPLSKILQINSNEKFSLPDFQRGK